MNPDLGCSGVNDSIRLLELCGLGEEGLNNVKSFLRKVFEGIHSMNERGAILFSSRLRSSSLLQIL
jgi:hypothetical protein